MKPNHPFTPARDARAAGLDALARRIAHDFEMLAPPADWIARKSGPDGRPMRDVIVIGAGMYGIAAALALRLQGISDVTLLDASPDGREGPWVTYARMETLRSGKHLPGPCLNIPSLTYRAWHEAAYGAEAWERLYKIPNADWQDYLTFVRRTLRLDLRSDTQVVCLVPSAEGVAVHLSAGDVIHARRVVLATGRMGTGGPAIPGTIARDLWPDRAAHTSEAIDFAALAGRRVAVIGAGASAWDNAATALEAGATVDLFCRRSALPQINKGRGSATPGYFEGWPALDDARKWALYVYMQDNMAPPPHETVHRTLANAGFTMHFNSPIRAVRRTADGLEIVRENATTAHDFLIAGTGFATDLRRLAMLDGLVADIAMWADRYTPPPALERPYRATSPWLGAGFELEERTEGCRPGLSRIHLFNHAAATCFGQIASDVPGVNSGAQRLAQAITAHFFVEDADAIQEALEAYSEAELAGTPYCTIAPAETV